MVGKSEQLAAIEASIVKADICSELAAGALNLVMGGGNLDADIVLIGEAPGKKEDETGMPFVGASGRFLDDMLVGAGLSRDDVYVTNIVKYRPPSNRDPSKDEKIAFLPYLYQQLAVIEPKVIITLGRHSGLSFMPELVISRDHGVPKVVQVGTQTMHFIPLYHPAAVLYNGSMRQVLIDDFSAAVDFAKTSFHLQK